MKKKAKSKISKVSTFGISSLIVLGSVSVGTGCYLTITSKNNTISSVDDNNSNIGNKPNNGGSSNSSDNKPPVNDLPNNDSGLPNQNEGNGNINTPGNPDNGNHGSDSGNIDGDQGNQGQGNQDNNNGGSSSENEDKLPDGGGQGEGGGSLPNHQDQPVTPEPSVPGKPDNNEPSNMMTFKINVVRSSGLHFKNYDPYFAIYNKDTNQLVKDNVSDADDNEWDGSIQIKLPDNANYEIKINDTLNGGGPGVLARTTYKYPDAVEFNKQKPEVDFVFDPIIVDTEKVGSYKIEDVSHELPYKTDACGNPISLKENREQGKMTILMHMKTTCPFSLRTLAALNKAIGWNAQWEQTPEMYNKVEVICFSDVNSQEELAAFQQEQWPKFHFVADHDNKIQSTFFKNDFGYPKLAFLDYQGVYVQTIRSEIKQDDAGKNLQRIRNWVNQYSKQGTTNEKK